jgi:hypothetical protein
MRANAQPAHVASGVRTARYTNMKLKTLPPSFTQPQASGVLTCVRGGGFFWRFETMTYSEKLKDPRWQKKRLKVMERDGFKCRDCTNDGKTLHVHHCFYEIGNPWDTDPEFLITLCKDCHDERHELEGRFQRARGKAFAQLPIETIRVMTEDMENINSDYDGVRILNEFDYEWMSDIRWFKALYNSGHKELYKTTVLKNGVAKT